MDQESLNKLLDKCFEELEKSYKGEVDSERAERNASLFLEMQLRLADVVSNAELKAKTAKNEIERISAAKYFKFKSEGVGDSAKKMTEVALEHAISQDEEVCKLKSEMIRYEADYKKWQHVINIIGNAHILARNIGKRDQNI